MLSASLFGALSYGQNEADVLRYSMTDFLEQQELRGWLVLLVPWVQISVCYP